MNRRDAIRGIGAAALLGASTAKAGETRPVVQQGRLRQSVARWCFSSMSIEDLCAAVAGLGMPAIDLLEIEEWRNHPVALLPYGIQNLVELGRALAMDPELLLLDEPVAGMNLEETEDMARFILDIRRELGISMIMVEHDMGLVMDIADRIMVLDFGQKIAEGTPDVIQSDPNVIAAYLGSSDLHVVPHDD